MTLYKIQRKYQRMSLFLTSCILRKHREYKSEKIRKYLLTISEKENIITSTSRKLRKLDKTFFKCKNACKKECLRITELNAENLFLKIRECSWNSELGLS